MDVMKWLYRDIMQFAIRCIMTFCLLSRMRLDNKFAIKCIEKHSLSGRRAFLLGLCVYCAQPTFSSQLIHLTGLLSS